MGREGAGRDMETCVGGGEGCASPVRVYLALESAHLRVPVGHGRNQPAGCPLAPDFLREAVEWLVGTGSDAVQPGVSRVVCYKYLIR